MKYIDLGPMTREDAEGRRMLDKNSEGGQHPSNWPGDVPASDHEQPNINYSGSENPGITNSRPIARSNPELGECDIEEGCSFRVPMGDQSDPYSG